MRTCPKGGRNHFKYTWPPISWQILSVGWYMKIPRAEKRTESRGFASKQEQPSLRARVESRVQETVQASIYLSAGHLSRKRTNLIASRGYLSARAWVWETRSQNVNINQSWPQTDIKLSSSKTGNNLEHNHTRVACCKIKVKLKYTSTDSEKKIL